MNVVIIEDEHLAAQKLSRTLKEIVPEIEISGIIPSVEKAVNFFERSSNTDLIFMDIQLDDGICFDIFEATNIEAPIIFITAFDEYTLRAFKQNSIDYLLKPIKKDELKNAIDKYRKTHQKVSASTLQKIINNFKTSEYKERFLIKVGEHYKSIETKSVNYFYIKEGSTFISTTEKRSYGIDYSLDKIEGLVDPKNFFRINRNFIVRFNTIENILAYSSNRLKVKVKGFVENEDVIVSRERVKAFKEWMDR
jgi:DNA-binding LytR/AlgR family response regulator